MTLWAVILAGAVAAAFAAAMLLSRSLYVSAVCLLVVLLQTALIFLLRGVPLLGFLQVMVYAGAVMVLVVITIMATGGGPSRARLADLAFPRWLAAAGLAAGAVELALALAAGPSVPGISGTPELAAAFSARLFGTYAPATEAAAVLMFLAALAVLPDEGAA